MDSFRAAALSPPVAYCFGGADSSFGGSNAFKNGGHERIRFLAERPSDPAEEHEAEFRIIKGEGVVACAGSENAAFTHFVCPNYRPLCLPELLFGDRAVAVTRRTRRNRGKDPDALFFGIQVPIELIWKFELLPKTPEDLVLGIQRYPCEERPPLGFALVPCHTEGFGELLSGFFRTNDTAFMDGDHRAATLDETFQVRVLIVAEIG